MKISVTILVKNGEATLSETLASLEGADEILVIDTGSTDKTVEIAGSFPHVRLMSLAFEGFGPTHNRASSLATHDWILSIDADEIASPLLLQEISLLPDNPEMAYALLRQNYFNGKHIKWCGWQNEWCTRLYNRKKTSFSDALVHEKVIVEGMKTAYLKSPLKHTPYTSISDFLRKMEHYSTLFAKEKVGKKKSNPLIALWHGFGAFLKSYFLKRGFCGGYEGYLISLYNGHTAFYKYLKLYHASTHHPL